MKNYLKYGIMGLIAAIVSAIVFKGKPEEVHEPSIRQYEEIVSSGILRAVTEYNSISFHVQEDTLGGLHYELLHAFAQAKGLKVEITPEMSATKRIEGIQNGNYDVLANNVLISSDRNDSLLFTHPILQSKQVLVQRKPHQSEDFLNSFD